MSESNIATMPEIKRKEGASLYYTCGVVWTLFAVVCVDIINFHRNGKNLLVACTF